jgi:purine nucleosidase
MKLAALYTAIALSLAISPLAAQQAPVRVPILIDTDLGSAVDDAFALGLALASTEVELAGVTTVGEAAEDRAWMVCRLLTHAGRSDVPVAFGRGEQPKGPIDWQIQYRRHPAVVWNRTNKPLAEPAVEFLYDKLKARPRELTIVALGPLTNVAQLLREHPDAKPLIKRIVIMGGALEIGYDGRPPAVAEWNIKQDIAAAKAVFDAGVPLLVVPLDATAGVKLTAEQRRKIFTAGTPLAFQLANLMELCEQPDQSLFDAVALAAAFDERFGTFAERKLAIADDGRTLVGEGPPNARVMRALRRDEFLAWTLDRLLAHGEPAWPAPPGNVSRLVERGGFPRRVHVVEDYETKIEKRWWLCGKLENKDLPPGGRRVCRAVLTQDFDDRQGNRRTSYRAVVFNPVPGPPMGPNTRLSFRYKLHGTDCLRVQLFSLSNGYHRYLSLAGLPQDAWQSATVDMTQMRRPDGSGGPLAADERIDDIQFYIDPRGELLIDDVVLYDAAAEGERRPFPKQIVFTGWFDTGKHGAEWPGDFEIVPHEQPRKWKFARSVAGEDGKQRLRVDLRGRRLLPNIVEVAFDYRMSGGDGIGVVLADRRGGETELHNETRVKPGGWSNATVRFEIPHADIQQFIDELRLVPPAGQTLEIDNLLIYEPGGDGPGRR